MVPYERSSSERVQHKCSVTNCPCSKYKLSLQQVQICRCYKYILYHSKTSRGADCLLLYRVHHSKTSRGADCLLGLLKNIPRRGLPAATPLKNVPRRGLPAAATVYRVYVHPTQKHSEARTAVKYTLKNIPRRGLYTAEYTTQKHPEARTACYCAHRV